MQRFPADLVNIIADYAAIWTIVSWVREVENTIKILPGWPDGITLNDVKLYYLCSNPMAEDELMKYNHTIPTELARNSANWAFDRLGHKIEYYELGSYDFLTNSNPRAIALIEKHIDQLGPSDWNVLLKNPAALELIKKYDGIKKASYPYYIYSNNNEDAWDLIKNNWPIGNSDILDMSFNLSFNSSTWAKRLMVEKNFSPDIVGMCTIQDPEFINNHISKHISTINDDDDGWEYLLKNPAAIHILRDHPDKVTETIWCNPAIFEPTHRPDVVPILTELSW